MNWVTDIIGIGNIDDVMNTHRLQTEGVTAILSLSQFPVLLNYPQIHKRVLMEDGPGNSIEILHEAVITLCSLAQRHKVLVHCMEGKSRSPFVVACFMASEQKISLQQAIDEIANKHPTGIGEYFYDLGEKYLLWRKSK